MDEYNRSSNIPESQDNLVIEKYTNFGNSSQRNPVARTRFWTQSWLDYRMQATFCHAVNNSKVNCDMSLQEPPTQVK